MSMFFLCSLFFAKAEPFQKQLPPHLQVHSLPHGPEGPLPDDGYEFKDDGEGGNFLAKLGLVCIVASGVTAVMAVRAESGSSDRELYTNVSLGLLGGGVGLIVLERTF